MHLDEFLNARSIAALQTMQWIWAPTTPRSSSKSQLLRLLRREMLSPERVRKRFGHLDETHQQFLRGLLRLDGYEGDVDLVTRRIAGPPLSPEARVDMLGDLAREGFINHSPTKGWRRREVVHALIPQELGDVLAEVLNLDTREPGLMLSLARFLDDGRARRPASAALEDPDQELARLLEPAAIDRRIADLPDPEIQQAVRAALRHPAGILRLERFPAHDLDIEAVDPAHWRKTLEGHRLGTFGHLSLVEHGLGDDHECLVLYREVVESHAAAQASPDRAMDHVYACGIDFLTDLSALADFVRSTPSKLTSAGRFFKGARNQLLPRTACRTTFYSDEDSLLALKVAVARALGVAEIRGDGRLHASHAALDWQALPLRDQARALLDVLPKLGDPSSATPHFRSLADRAVRLVRELPCGAWLPTAAFLAIVVARHLLDLVERPQAAGPPSTDAPTPWAYPRPGDTLTAVADLAAEPLLRALNYTGLIDVGRHGGTDYLRPTPLVPTLLGDAEPPRPAKLLMVNPDGEVVLFPEEGHVELLHRLCAFCDREKTEVTLHLRISQDSIQRAALRGLDPDAIIATLRAHCRVPLSQNIDYSIRNWAASVHPAAVRTLHVLELPSPEILDAAVQLPELAPLVLRRLSPTALVLEVPDLDPEAQDALKQLGIFLT